MISWNKPTFEDWKNISKYSHFIAEPKLDGMRCYAIKENGALRLVRDGGSVKTLQFPEIMNTLNIPDGTILDGEICIKRNEFETDFQAISQRMNLKDSLRIKLLSNKDPASFVAFDILQHDNEIITNQSLIHRKKILESIKVSQVEAYDMLELQKSVKEFDMEGMVLKDPNGTYNKGKWLKFKNIEERDFKVVGITSTTRPISSLILANGMGNVTYQPNMDQTINPVGKTAVVKYLVMKNKKQKLRFPVLKELR